MQEAVAAFLNSVSALCPKVSSSELEYLAGGLSVTEWKARHFYLHAGTVQTQIGFVYSGLIRAFYIDGKGHEISVHFMREGQYATHYPAFLSQTASKYHFQCIEPTVTVDIPFSLIQEGYDKFQNLDRFGRLIADSVLIVQQKRIEGFLFENAEERYLAFVRENPDLFNRVSISQLASYLGIERQSLTRIRKKLAHYSF